jgi:predicted metal-dependent hydrolase
MRVATQQQIRLGGRSVDYRVVCSPAARKMRVRVGFGGVEVIQPKGRSGEEVIAFLLSNEPWILGQLKRLERIRNVRRPDRRQVGEILFRGEPTRIRIEQNFTSGGGNKVALERSQIVVRHAAKSPATPQRSLETWLRRQARAEIERHLAAVTKRLQRLPRKVYIMDQRTKWGNCSAMQNLSFNWRLILAPDFVLRYLVTHESVHLAVPDHSARFWLTVQSLCPETERAKQWLSANGQKLLRDLRDVCPCGDNGKMGQTGH